MYRRVGCYPADRPPLGGKWSELFPKWRGCCSLSGSSRVMCDFGISDSSETERHTSSRTATKYPICIKIPQIAVWTIVLQSEPVSKYVLMANANRTMMRPRKKSKKDIAVPLKDGVRRQGPAMQAPLPPAGRLRALASSWARSSCGAVRIHDRPGYLRRQSFAGPTVRHPTPPRRGHAKHPANRPAAYPVVPAFRSSCGAFHRPRTSMLAPPPSPLREQ